MRRFLIAATFFAANSFAAAQTNPIRLIVPYAHGGPIDTLRRAVAQNLGNELKQPVVVKNRTGADEILSTEHVAKEKPDGLTFLIATGAGTTMDPHFYKKLSYDPQKDFEPVTQLASVPILLLTSPGVGSKDAKGPIELASRSPGKISHASAGLGGITRVPMVMLEKYDNVSLVHVPYKGASELLPDLLTGTVQLALLDASFSGQYVRAGTLVPLAVSAPMRIPSMPSPPTFIEQGLKDTSTEKGSIDGHR